MLLNVINIEIKIQLTRSLPKYDMSRLRQFAHVILSFQTWKPDMSRRNTYVGNEIKNQASRMHADEGYVEPRAIFFRYH